MCAKSREDIILYSIKKFWTQSVSKHHYLEVGGQNFWWFSCFWNSADFKSLRYLICPWIFSEKISNTLCVPLGMSNTQTLEQKRWLVATTYTELKSKKPAVSPSNVYNTLRFKGHREITRRFVYRTIKRFKESNSVSLPP